MNDTQPEPDVVPGLLDPVNRRDLDSLERGFALGSVNETPARPRGASS